MVKPSENLLLSVFQSIRKNSLLEPNERVLIAVSGGPDSVALTLILNEISKKYKQNWYLVLVHLNHGLRGKESLRDERFVKDLGRKLGLPVYTKLVSLKKELKGYSKGLEALARETRYNFLESVANKIKADKVASGHTLDDQSETVLMRILRGTALKGLRGIPSIRALKAGSKIMVIRPLLNTERRSLIRYLKENRQEYCTDSTNLQDDFLRNKIRLNLLPQMEKHHKGTRFHLARIGETSHQAYDYIHKEAQKVIKLFEERKIISDNSIEIKELKKLHPALQIAVLDSIMEKVKGDLQGISYQHYELLMSLVETQGPEKAIVLPGGIVAHKEKGKIIFRLAPAYGGSILPIRQRLLCNRIKVPGQTVLKPHKLIVKASIIKNTGDYLARFRQSKTPYQEIFDLDKIDLPLTIRYRTSGDRFHPIGASGAQSVKKFFIDRKISRKERENIPLLCDKNRIIWVTGYRISDKAKITPATKRVLKIELIRG
jgi:tRNA(Ile)-lysidine synthase